MNDHNWFFTAPSAPIPPEFHSLELDGPFTNCVLCQADLLADDETPYVIERIFRGVEPILEYAMCLTCQADMSSEFSQESLCEIEKFFADVDFHARLQRLQRHFVQPGTRSDVSAWIDECLVSGKRRTDCRGYQIFALCRGTSISLGNLPGMLSDDAAEAIAKRLSQKTRDYLGDFTSETFGMPPEFCDSPDFTPLLL